ncbi:MAG: 50S ribosomal protein L25 [Bacteroidetes bacterium]|nr:MAG: 50S ribosomal protein L25 [Bacteroidota bacterium]
MKTIALKATVREQTGKTNAKQSRKEGMIPAVIYHNSEATHILLEESEARKVIYTPEVYIISLETGNKAINTILRNAQFHPVTEKILDMEFLAVSDDKPVVLTLPVRLQGTPVGVAKGGKLTLKLRKIKVKGIPSQLPDAVVVNVAKLDLGGTIKVSEAGIEGIEVVTSPSAAIASVEIPRSLRSTKEAAKK